MKTENTPQAKMRFFALYWGQNTVCIRISDAPDKKGFAVDLCDWKVAHKDSYLELTPLSQISDEDALAISLIINKKFPKTASVEDGRKFIEKWRTNNVLKLEIGWINTVIEVYHKLISLGYYIGDGTEVEYGWVKLKGGKA